MLLLLLGHAIADELRLGDVVIPVEREERGEGGRVALRGAGTPTLVRAGAVWHADEATTGGVTVVREAGSDVQSATLEDVWGSPVFVQCADDALVVAAFRSGGTVFLDRGAKVVARTRDGHAANATSTGPACSPDGRWVAVPTPYEHRVTVFDARTGAEVARLEAPSPGSVQWTDAGLRIVSYPLPYE